jgi:hypothetical protein
MCLHAPVVVCQAAIGIQFPVIMLNDSLARCSVCLPQTREQNNLEEYYVLGYNAL